MLQVILCAGVTWFKIWIRPQQSEFNKADSEHNWALKVSIQLPYSIVCCTYLHFLYVVLLISDTHVDFYAFFFSNQTSLQVQTARQSIIMCVFFMQVLRNPTCTVNYSGVKVVLNTLGRKKKSSEMLFVNMFFLWPWCFFSNSDCDRH